MAVFVFTIVIDLCQKSVMPKRLGQFVNDQVVSTRLDEQNFVALKLASHRASLGQAEFIRCAIREKIAAIYAETPAASI